jgi:arginine N-succinyltransferase
MLRRIGFRYAERIDPFDGGPHFVAPLEEISLIGQSAPRSLGFGEPARGAAVRALVARDYPAAPYFRALVCAAELGASSAVVRPETGHRLELGAGDSAWFLPLGALRPSTPAPSQLETDA